MSRIFEALQRSESEQSGSPLATPALATELLQAVERKSLRISPDHLAESNPLTNDLGESGLAQFQSLPISLTQESKLICLTAPERQISLLSCVREIGNDWNC